MAETDFYKEWLASGTTDDEIVETVQITHAGGAFADLLVVNADRDLTALLEDGTTRKFTAGRFMLEPAETTDTTSQSTTISVSALDGMWYTSIKNMTYEERAQAITLVHRLYRLRDPLAGPLMTPPPSWTVNAVEATLEAVRAEIRAEELRMQKIGLYYTAREFPALVYL